MQPVLLLQKSLDEVDPKLLETFSKLGIPINEQKRLAGVKDVAYDYVFDSESIATTFKKELAVQGIIFCSISEAVREYPELVKKHLGSVVGSFPWRLPFCDIASLLDLYAILLRDCHVLAAWLSKKVITMGR